MVVAERERERERTRKIESNEKEKDQASGSSKEKEQSRTEEREIFSSFLGEKALQPKQELKRYDGRRGGEKERQQHAEQWETWRRKSPRSR